MVKVHTYVKLGSTFQHFIPGETTEMNLSFWDENPSANSKSCLLNNNNNNNNKTLKSILVKKKNSFVLRWKKIIFFKFHFNHFFKCEKRKSSFDPFLWSKIMLCHRRRKTKPENSCEKIPPEYFCHLKKTKLRLSAVVKHVNYLWDLIESI